MACPWCMHGSFPCGRGPKAPKPRVFSSVSMSKCQQDRSLWGEVCGLLLAMPQKWAGLHCNLRLTPVPWACRMAMALWVQLSDILWVFVSCSSSASLLELIQTHPYPPSKSQMLQGESEVTTYLQNIFLMERDTKRMHICITESLLHSRN